MTIAQARALLGSDDIKVEAGGSFETTVEVASTAAARAEGFEEYDLRVRGLPDRWYTLSTTRLRVPAGERATALLVIHLPHDDQAAPLGEHLFSVELAPHPGGVTTALEARLLALPPGGIARHSRLLEYLPGMFRGDPFLARFLLIFQSIVDPIEETIDQTHLYLDPSLTPASFLPWLASWVGLELDPGLGEGEQRALIRRAVEVSRWKGTRRGLREELRARSGARCLIVENFDGMRLGQDACLGLNTHLGIRRDQGIAVTLATEGPAALDQRQAERLVDELKPAHVGHVVRLVSAPNRVRGGDHG